MKGTDVIKFLHVLSVIVWVGGGAMLQALLHRARKLGPEMVAEFSQAAAWTSRHIFMPASFAALAFGIAGVIMADAYGFSDLWITLGFVGFAASAVLGMAVLGPTSKKMAAMGAERGPHDPVVTYLARRIQLVGRIDLLILIAVVFDMVVKPGLE